MRQVSGLTVAEVAQYRRLLYEQMGTVDTPSPTLVVEPRAGAPVSTRSSHGKVGGPSFLTQPWRPLGLDEGRPTLFAYKASNRCDGVCRIERVDLSDGRVVIICEEIDGNPGQSVTN